jgi:guanyl-specific ribonuclease Sa
MLVNPIIRILQHFITVMTAVTVVMGISAVAVVLPQAAYATEDEENSSSSGEDEECSSDELPARIDGTIRCMEQGECYSYEFEGKEVKHCNY